MHEHLAVGLVAHRVNSAATRARTLGAAVIHPQL